MVAVVATRTAGGGAVSTPDTDQPRPVWLTGLRVQEIVTMLRALGLQLADEMAAALEADWDAAPADATETAAVALATCLAETYGVQADAVLRALGKP